ncbi:uncharacterized protein LOC135208239 [Macrobrachium nipponense]|uniref:uncharacterized protein LOC135208239 n=1 Tax=Macrobrachium nipponense TaxID=159736 RepID=UPI0030C8C5AA
MSKQKAYAYCYSFVVGRSDECMHSSVGVGERCVVHFLVKIAEDWARIRETMVAHKISMTSETIRQFEQATHCKSCNIKFTNNTIKVRHHTHHKLTDNYVCTLCRKCNFNLKYAERTLPVLSHNLSYDAALILKEVATKHNFEILKRDGDTFYSLKTGNIRLMDSAHMIRGLLFSRVASHIKQKGALEITRQMLSKYPDECAKLVLGTGKQYYPYGYVTGFEVFQKLGIPPKVCFNSSMTGESIPCERYEHICKVWNAANCFNLLDYTVLYLLMDVGLLGGVYLAWRKAAYTQFGLDPVYYLMSTSLSLDALLHTASAPPPNFRWGTHQLITNNIRGGFCSVVQRHAIANNPELNPQFKAGD